MGRGADTGQRHHMGLGSTDTIALATARVKAHFCRQLMLDGKDPLSERRAAGAAYMLVEAKRITFDQCTGAYIDVHRGNWKNPKHSRHAFQIVRDGDQDIA